MIQQLLERRRQPSSGPRRTEKEDSFMTPMWTDKLLEERLIGSQGFHAASLQSRPSISFAVVCGS
jgi:hypothetical protein